MDSRTQADIDALKNLDDETLMDKHYLFEHSAEYFITMEQECREEVFRRGIQGKLNKRRKGGK